MAFQTSEGRIMAKLNDRLLTAREAVDFLGISLSTLRKIEREGHLIPFRTPGGHRRYDLSMLEEYLETTRVKPPGKNPATS
jgi:excisionase family DNA binding protein